MKIQAILILIGLVNFGAANAFANYCYCDSTDVYKQFSDSQSIPGIKSCVHFVTTDTDGKILSDNRGSCVERYWPVANTAENACMNRYADTNSFCK